MIEDDFVICPECGHEQPVKIITSVNVTTDPDMREKVMSGEIFKFGCEECGFEGYAGFEFIYEDKQTNGGFLVYLEPDCEDRVVGIEMPDLADQVIYRDVAMRLVSDINSLKEKILIFEAGLDDRVVELFKYLTLTKLEGDPNQIPDEMRFAKVGGEENDKTIILAAFKEGGYVGILELPYSLYQSCLINGSDIWDVALIDCVAVDSLWIEERIKEDAKKSQDEEEHCYNACSLE